MTGCDERQRGPAVGCMTTEQRDLVGKEKDRLCATRVETSAVLTTQCQQRLRTAEERLAKEVHRLQELRHDQEASAASDVDVVELEPGESGRREDQCC